MCTFKELCLKLVFLNAFSFIFENFFCLFVSFILTLLGCAVTCKPELSRPLKATAVPGIWTGQKLIGPMAV